MEDDKIKAIKPWFEPKSVRDIQLFIRFANFYWQFIQGFSQITVPLTSLLKTTKSIGLEAEPKLTKARVGSNIIVGSGEVSNYISSIKQKNQAKITKSKNLLKSKNRDFPLNSKNMEAGSGFLTPKARLALIKLRQVFIKTLIFHHFNSICNIRI